ncbi:MAG: hypothetical protein U0452_08045 [Anaerolineae bacterium]
MKRTLVFMLLFVGLTASLASAQESLTFNTPVRGEVTPGQSETRTFSGKAGQVISLLVNSAGTLDPVLTLLNADGAPILTDDDFAWPEAGDSLLQAVTLPYTGRYSIQVSGFDNTAGQYTLTISEGYAIVQESLPLDSAQGWTSMASSLQVQSTDAGLMLTMRGVRTSEAAFGVPAESADLAAFVDVVNVTNPSGWVAGLALRRVGDAYNAVQINSEGRWRFVRIEGDEQTVIRDWTSHPAIVAGQSSFRLGAFAKGSAFDFFYDGAFIGSASDDTLAEPGEAGLVAGTISSVQAETRATFANLTLTRPLQVDGQMPIPQQVVVGDGTTMAQSLSRRHVVQGDGQMMLTVPEASVNYARPGVNRLMLGQGTEFGDFAYGGTVRINQLTSGQSGCGLVVRYSGETDYALAWLDGQGAYGLSQRAGDEFAPGLYGENSDLDPTAPHQLLVIASDHILYFYVDGLSAGQLEVPSTQGEVGAAVVNFEGIDTTCTFFNLWLWRWE